MREMKDSGIEWIGEIPKEWNVIKNKYLISVLYSGGTPSATNGNFYCQEVGIPFVSISDMSNCSYVVKTAKHITESGIEDKKLRILPIGTILYSIYATVGAISELKVEATISQAILAIQLNSKIDKSFYKYNLTAMRDYIFSNASGNTQFNLNAEKVRNFYFVLPTFSAQRRIADYLDDKCGKIDRYIEQQKQVIEKLKAYKQSVITEAVTKGLDPTVPMKDSGVEWIGEIPESWVVVKATRLILSTQNGLTRRDLEKSNGNIVLKLRNINSRGEIDYSEINRIVLSSKEVETYQLIDGDFLFVRVNGSRSLVGKCAIYNGISEIVAYNDHIIRVRLNNFCDKDFFKWFLLSDVGKKEIDIHTSTSAGQFTISGDGLRNLNVILPKKEIQREIVVYLNQKCSSIDFAIEKKQALIEKLTEYKKSLIYEVVTGKKEV